MIWVQDPKAKSEPQGQSVSLKIAQQEEDKYSVGAKFANVGNVHFAVTCQGEVSTGTGASVASAPMETATATLLPLGIAEFSGVLDFADVEPGEYVLTATMTYGEQQVHNSLPVTVEETEEGKVVTILESAAAAEEATTEPAEENDEQANTPAASE